MKKLLLLALVACSSKKDDAPKSRMFRDLDGPAANAYCKQAQTDRRTMQPLATRSRCATTALNLAGDAANDTADKMRDACVKSFTACVANPPKAPDLDCDSNELTANLARCADLTVDEMAACTDEMRAAMVASDKTDPCAVAFDPKQPAAPFTAFKAKLKGDKCAVVSAKCKEPEHQ